MAYTRTWNAAYEESPAGSDLLSTVDNRIKDNKTDIRERMEKDHYMAIAGTDADHGEHKQVTLRVGAYAGSGSADKAVIHAVDVGAKARPCYYDEDGVLLRMVALPGGNVTVMPFFQAAAPLGWTQVTTVTDAFLRVVSTAGGDTGGTASAATLAHTHSNTFASAAHTLTTAQIPAHTHIYNQAISIVSSDTTPPGTAFFHSYDPSAVTGSTGGSTGHSHTFSGSVSSASISPKYANVITCSLN